MWAALSFSRCFLVLPVSIHKGKALPRVADQKLRSYDRD